MSSLVSGVGKIFTSIGSGVARLTSAFKGVGAVAGTAGAATGTASSGLGSLFGGGGGGGGILSNIFSGVSSLFGGSTIGTTAGDFAGPWGQSLAGAATAATSATGAFPVAGAAGAGGLKGLGSGLLDFAKSEGGAGLIAGLGAGIGKYQELQSIEDMQATNLAYLQKQEDDRRSSYDVGSSALVGYNEEPKPKRQSTARIKIPQVATYDPNDGMIKMTATA
jgi:hypothetical protein